MNVLLITEKNSSDDRIKEIITASIGECEFIACSPGLAVLSMTRSFTPDMAVIQLNHQADEAPGLARHLKTLERPVYTLLIAGTISDALLEQAVDAGADDFITGNYSDSELSIRLKKGLRPGEASYAAPVRRKEKAQRQQVSSEPRPKGKRPLAGVARVCGNIAFGSLLVIMAVLAFFLVQSKFAGGVPSVFGYRMYVVLSGSMSPAFDTGSLAFVREADAETIGVGDIITFGNPDGGVLTTHRVVDVHTDGDLRFTTRGDANNVDDPNPVRAENIVGRVHGSVPYLGYLMGFSQTRQGLIFLVFIPGVLVIAFELRNIYKQLGEQEKGKKKREGRGDSIREQDSRHTSRVSSYPPYEPERPPDPGSG